MASLSKASAIREYVIHNVGSHPRDISVITARRFGVTRQAINHHLRNLVKSGVLKAEGKTRARKYQLAAEKTEFSFSLAQGVEEDVVWRDRVAPLLTDVPENVYEICHHGFTEMVNNAIDHSEGTVCRVMVVRTAAFVEIWITDDGVGIFRKIRTALSLPRETDAVLELVKGKFTTDPSRHTGEGIFFTTRMFDNFGILAGNVYFCHMTDSESDWVLERISKRGGTTVTMTIDVASDRSAAEVFDQFAKPDEFAFSVTHVPVGLARHGEENLISRSQAKRLVNRFERFEDVWLDFTDVNKVGQAFADEVFRVFQLEHPDVVLHWVNANPEVERMISRARSALTESIQRNQTAVAS